MAEVIELRDIDKDIYAEQLRDFLPERLIDVHSHIWVARPDPDERPAVALKWSARVAAQNPVEDHLECYRLLFPGKAVTPMVFSKASSTGNMEQMNAYVSRSAKRYGFPALLYTHPGWSGEAVERQVLEGGFLGIKVYLDLAPAYLPRKEVRILDFLPPHQLEVVNQHRWIVMLHVPRAARLRDPVNLAQILEIERRYPGVQLILAHVGRAYCNEDVGDAFKVLEETERLVFDISANTNSWVFARLIEAVGPKRVLFGSDLPILRMRMRRICENGSYVNIVPKGAYGDVSADPHMREVEGADAELLTLFMYEELLAFRRAAEEAGLSPEDLKDVFHDNASRLIQVARSGR